MSMLSRWRALWSAIDPKTLRLGFGRCPYCGPTWIVRLNSDETGIRCLRCAASAVHLSLGWALVAHAQPLHRLRGYELSSRGPLVAWLRMQCAELATSEYFDDVAPGTLRDGVRCEDVQHLSFADASFDLVTHTEVFEHVPDDAQGFRELHRVLRPGGLMLFTVPLHDAVTTIERAQLREGELVHLLPPTYHSDRLRGAGRVLCYRDYGRDIVSRLTAAGFIDSALLPPDPRVPWNSGRYVVLARKST